MLRHVLKRLFEDHDVLYECRNCGSHLTEKKDYCPRCGAEEIAVYEFGNE
jgi:uncharacterized OB-fold protein